MAYKVQRRLNVTGAVYSTVFTTAIGIVAYTDSGLSANTGYCYQVRTTDPSGAMVDSTPTAEVCGTTLKDAATPPAGAVTVIFN